MAEQTNPEQSVHSRKFTVKRGNRFQANSMLLGCQVVRLWGACMNNWPKGSVQCTHSKHGCSLGARQLLERFRDKGALSCHVWGVQKMWSKGEEVQESAILGRCLL